MIFSGAELIRTSGQQAELSQRLQVVKEPQSIPPVETSGGLGSSLDRQQAETKDLKSAFSRLAQFLGHNNKDKKKPSLKETNSNRVVEVLEAYAKQASSQPGSNLGQMLDLYI